jgi:hypothetical protein
MESILFLTSKGVVELWRNNSLSTFNVYLERRYIGLITNNELRQHNEENPVFNEKEKQLLVNISLKKVVPASLIRPIHLIVNGGNWIAERYTLKTYRVKCSMLVDRGFIWQEVVDGRLMWISDRITTEILMQIAPQMLTLRK